MAAEIRYVIKEYASEGVGVGFVIGGISVEVEAEPGVKCNQVRWQMLSKASVQWRSSKNLVVLGIFRTPPEDKTKGRI